MGGVIWNSSENYIARSAQIYMEAYYLMLNKFLYIMVPGFTAGKTISTCVYMIWEILANMTQVSDVAPGPLVFLLCYI